MKSHYNCIFTFYWKVAWRRATCNNFSSVDFLPFLAHGWKNRQYSSIFRCIGWRFLHTKKTQLCSNLRTSESLNDSKSMSNAQAAGLAYLTHSFVFMSVSWNLTYHTNSFARKVRSERDANGLSIHAAVRAKRTANQISIKTIQVYWRIRVYATMLCRNWSQQMGKEKTSKSIELEVVSDMHF